MFLTLKDRWNHLEKEEVARKVKHFFRSYAINRHKTNVMTPTYLCFVIEECMLRFMGSMTTGLI